MLLLRLRQLGHHHTSGQRNPLNISRIINDSFSKAFLMAVIRVLYDLHPINIVVFSKHRIVS